MRAYSWIIFSFFFLSEGFGQPITAGANNLPSGQLRVISRVPQLCTVAGIQDLNIQSLSDKSDGSISGSSNMPFMVNCTKINGDFVKYQVTVNCRNNAYLLANQNNPSSSIRYQIRFSGSQDASNGEILRHGQRTSLHYFSGSLANTQKNAAFQIEIISTIGEVSTGEYADNCSLTVSSE